MSEIKVDALSTVSGSGNITASNTIAGTSATLSGTLAVTGNSTANSINLGGRTLGAGGTPLGVNFSSAATNGMQINDTNSGNLGGMLGFYSGSGTGTLRANIQNANNAGVHMCVGTGGSIVFDQTGYTAANALDDYEEGTWSPVLDFGGGSTGISYSTQSGKYTKIGNVVHFSFRLYLSSKGSSTGHAAVSGFPFAADAMPTGGVFQLTPARGWLGDNDEPMYLYFAGGTRMTMYQNDWDGTANAAVDHSQFANNTELELTASYFTNS